MKKLKWILVGLFLSVNIYNYAQDSLSVRSYKHEIGFDATFILKSVMTINNYYPYSNYDTTVSILYYYNYSTLNNYILSYKYNFNDKIGMRIGYGQSIANTNYEKTSISSSNTVSTTNQKLQRYNFYTRAGIQINKILNKKWCIYYGTDLIGAYKYSKTKTKNVYPYGYGGNPTTETKTQGIDFGLGPFLGLKLNISERIFLSTETSLYGIYSINDTDSNTDYISTSSPSYNSHSSSSINTSGFNVNLNVPINIFLTIKF